MRYWLVALALVLQQQADPERYPGQSEHRAPPEGWVCEHQNYELSVPPAHVCVCERVYDATAGAIREDRQCAVYCHPTHCHCPVARP